MSPATAGLIGLTILFLLLAMGLPVSMGMAVVGFAGFAYLTSTGAALTKLAVVPVSVMSTDALMVIPLFTLMAYITFHAGLSKDLYDLAYKWLGSLPGGLAMATVGACAIFAASVSSAMACTITMGLVVLPEMKRYKYDPGLATGTIVSAGTLGSLIPPSSILIIYGIIAEVSIGKLFMAGVLPGVLEASMYLITIYILCRINPALGPRGPKTSFKEKMAPLGRNFEIAALILLIMGGIFFGYFTPTEAGAVGAFGAIIFSLIRKRLNWASFVDALLETARTSGMIFALIIGAFILNYFLTISTIPVLLAKVTAGLPLPPMVIMGLIMLVYLVLGCFIDALAMVFLTIPIFLPIVISLGFSPIWFGIIMTRMQEIAGITPPIGMGVYTMGAIAPDVPMQTVFKGAIPFVISDIVNIALLLIFPQIILLLPGIMTY